MDYSVGVPSFSVILHKAKWLVALLDNFTDSRFSKEAVKIREVYRILLLQVIEEMETLRDKRRTPQWDSRLREIAKAVQELFATLRYLHASDPKSSPPGVQVAVSRLVERYLAPALKCLPTDIVLLVRPQWKYCLKYLNLLEQLRYIVVSNRILPEDYDLNSPDALFDFLSSKWKHGAPPRFVSVVSFAGLDRDSVLLYPLLAHEIGHSLFYSHWKLNGRNPLEAFLPSDSEISGLIQNHLPSLPTDHRTPSAKRARLDLSGKKRGDVSRLILKCLEEIAADLIATRMMGPSYFMAMVEYFQILFPLRMAPLLGNDGYPGVCHRFQMVLSELLSPLPAMNAGSGIEAIVRKDTDGSLLAGLQYLREWQSHLIKYGRLPIRVHNLPTALYDLAVRKVESALPRLHELVREIVPSRDDGVWEASDQLPHMIHMLQAGVPPFPSRIFSESTSVVCKPPGFADIMTVGWFHLLNLKKGAKIETDDRVAMQAEYGRTCSLVYKALELEGSCDAMDELDKGASTGKERDSHVPMDQIRPSGVASGPFLLEALGRIESDLQLLVVPLYNVSNIQCASLDVHLGNWFRVARRSANTSIDLSIPEERKRVRLEGQDEFYVRYKEKFVLHPGDFALGITLEYFSFPRDLMGYVEGKSGLGRTGLIIATATPVAPGFKGSIVLELFNAGTVPVVLRPGMRIAQVVFHILDRTVPRDWSYSGGYQCQIRP